jgi:DNA/RNA-binding domain of Phe-tRNA-synthetase-like protein
MEYLTNVFQRYFIEKIQPIASQMNHYQYQLSPIFEKMLSHPNLSPNFKQYINQSNQQGFKNYQVAMQQHIHFWQDLFKRCNIKPGKR